MLEQIIQLVTILFLLSMVCERIADFFKHYLNQSSRLRIGDTLTKFPTDDLREKARAYRILKINVWCGILTAAILKADLIKIFNNIENPGITIGWSTFPNYWGDHEYLLQSPDFWFLIPGIVLTGCFISFGSKFWHDLLDILLEIKNAKRAITEINTQQSQGPVAEFEKLSPNEKDLLLKSAIQGYSKYWEASISNYKRVDAGKKITNNVPTENNSLRFYVESKEYKGKVTSPVPEYIFFGGYKIPTDVIKDSGEMTLHLNWRNPGDGTTPVLPGKSVSRVKNKATGTISLKVKKTIDGDTGYYVLSCFHVLFDNEFYMRTSEVKNTESAVAPKRIKTPGDDVTTQGTSVAIVGWGMIDSFVDAGVALLDDPDSVSEDIDRLGKPLSNYQVITDDENKLKVSFCGARSGLVENKMIKGCHATQEVSKTPVGKIIFEDLIKIEKCSDHGDSGAPVVDQFNRLIGIIEGSDKEFTYIIPIQNIINRLGIQTITKN